MIRGTGSYIPDKVLTNSDFEKMVDTSDDWIVERTGIKERHVLNGTGNVRSCADMATIAGRRAIEDAGLKPTDIDCIVVGTVTPDYPLPAVATMVQENLQVGRAVVMDIVAACAGFLYGLTVARAFVNTGVSRNVLVIGSEHLTSITNYEDRNTCVLFGDGAGGAVVTAGRPGEEGRGILSTFLSGDGQYRELLHIPLGGALNPLTPENVESPDRFIKMDGREVFKLAVREMTDACDRVLAEAGVTSDQLDMVIPHQANARIIEALGKKLHVNSERVYRNIERFGNTSSASVPIALDEARRTGKVGEGSLILSVAFGGGLVWGAALYRL
jgi:3-oxoacyl-[acyl-carrier-protein] synthase-3